MTSVITKTYRDKNLYYKIIVLSVLVLIISWLFTLFMPTQERKVILICLNGGSWKIVQPLIERGELPSFKFMIENGAYGNFSRFNSNITLMINGSTEYSEEPLQWATIITGKLPERHGIKGFSEKSDSFKTKTLWNYVNEHGKSIGLLSWLTTWPPPNLDGFVVPGWAPEFTTYPPFLKNELGGLELGTYDIGYMTDKIPNEFLKDTVKVEFNELKRISEYYQYLEKEFNPDVFVIGIFGPDHLQHVLWKYSMPDGFEVSQNDISIYGDIIPEFYIKFDEYILSKAIADGKNTVFLISDHGFHSETPPTKMYLLFLDRLLEKGGLLRYKDDGNIDFSETIAYTQFGGIHLHKYCYSDGTCKSDSEIRKVYVNENYENSMEEVVDFFNNIIIPESENFFILEPYPSENIVKVSINITEFETISEEIEKIDVEIRNKTYPFEDFFHIYEHSGEHYGGGLVVVYGNSIKKNYEIKNATLLDITPTILHTLNIDVPENLDGKVLEEIFVSN